MMKKILSHLSLATMLVCCVTTAYSAGPKPEIKHFDNDSLLKVCYNKPCKPPKGYKKLVKELSDEFNGNELDLTKWRSGGNGGWKGRGARFMADNITVKGGCLQLKSSLIGTEEQLKELYQFVERVFVDDSTKHLGDKIDVHTWDPAYYGDSWQAKWKDPRYNEIQEMGLDILGAASVISLEMGTKGYYEARIRVSNICLSSAFWMQGRTTEYDITESIGSYNVTKESMLKNLEGHRRRVGTSVWINEKELKGKGGVPAQHHFTEEPLNEMYIVLGLKWEDELLTVYFNDKEIYNFPLRGRVTAKDNIPIPVETFKAPQHVIFDTEVLLGPTMGWPTLAELLDPNRNIFYIDWVRVWK
ncbi:MAG: hypothetical protein SNH13_00990 [Rikenellaceae bacterium]